LRQDASQPGSATSDDASSESTAVTLVNPNLERLNVVRSVK
jgi:two-component system sensor histidine kinase RcsD